MAAGRLRAVALIGLRSAIQILTTLARVQARHNVSALECTAAFLHRMTHEKGATLLDKLSHAAPHITKLTHALLSSQLHMHCCLVPVGLLWPVMRFCSTISKVCASSQISHSENEILGPSQVSKAKA